MTDTGSHQTDIINQYHQENNELRESLRRKTKDCEAAVVELKRVQEQSLAWFQDSANKDAQLKGLEAALASEQAHHQYDCARKDAAIHRLAKPSGHYCLGTTGHTPYCMDILDSLTPSTPQEAEAWAREQKDGKEK